MAQMHVTVCAYSTIHAKVKSYSTCSAVFPSLFGIVLSTPGEDNKYSTTSALPNLHAKCKGVSQP